MDIIPIALILSRLGNASNYSKAISRLYKKLSNRHALLKSKHDSIGITDLFYDKETVAKILAHDVMAGEHQFEPPTLREIVKKGKKRLVCDYCLTDKVVQHVLYDALAQFLPKYLPSNVYSYVKGRSSHQAILKLINFIKTKRSDLYVLYADISSYSDCMDISANSNLWRELLKLIGIESKEDCPNHLWNMIDANIRPILLTPEGYPYQNVTGLLTGSPLTTLCCNLYARPLDDYLSDITDGFYARYGDDFIFAHTKLATFKKIEAEIEAILKSIKLSFNPAKKQRLYLTRAGKPCPEEPKLRGSSSINFLGFSVNANGNISLGKQLLRRFYHAFSRRIHSCGLLLSAELPEEREKALVSAANTLLNRETIFHESAIKIIKRYIDDRAILKQIDYKIALCIAEVCSGLSGVRAFRKVPMHKLYNIWNLHSLSCNKNYGEREHDQIKRKYS